jgi:GAF domain-containing protein/ActR/RegA family two-component response regulator
VSEDPLLNTVVESKKPLLLTDTLSSKLWQRSPDNLHVRSWIAAPLLRGDRVIGLLILDHSRPNTYNEEIADLLSAIAAQAAVAIHNARLYTQAQDRSRQLHTAAEVSRAASSILDPNPLIAQTVNLIRERFGLYYVGLFLVDKDGIWTREPGKWAVLRAGTGDAGRIQIEREHKLESGGTSMIGQCISTAQPQISQQIGEEDQHFANPLLPETRSEMALPLISRGQVIGAMTIQSTEAAAFSDEDIAILQTMADQVGNALLNANLFDQTQARAEELAVLNEMSRRLTSTVDIDDMTRNIYLFTSRLIDTSTFFLALYDHSTNQIDYPLAIEDNQEITIPSRRKGQGLTEHVINSREPLLIQEDINGWLGRHGVDLIPIGSETENQIAESWLGVPMLVGDQARGVIGVQHNDPFHYNQQDLDLLVAIASQGAIAFQNASLFAETRQRTEDLAILNEMSRELATLLDINMVFNTVYEYTSRLMDTTNFFIALYESENQEISNPYEILNNEVVDVSNRVLGSELSDYVIRNRSPLLLNGEDILQQELDLGIERVAPGEELPPKSWLGVPMMIGERVLGVISVQSLSTPFLYKERHRDLLGSIASQVAITIQNTYLFEQTEQQLSDLMAIQQTTTELSAAITLDDVITTLLENLVTSVQADTVSMFFLQGNNLIRMGMFPFPEDEGELGQTISLDDYPLTKNAIETRRPMALAADDPRLHEQTRKAFTTSGISANMTVPLIGPEGALGTLSINRKHPSPLFNEQEINLLDTLANQAAISLQNARLFEQIQQRSEELQLINRVVSQVAASLDLKESLQIIANELGIAIKADSVGVALLNDDRITLKIMADYTSRVGTPSAMGLELPIEGNPAFQKVIETKKPIVISDPQNNPLTKSIHDAMRRRGVQTIMITPLLVSGEVIGTIGLDITDANRSLNEGEIRLIETIILQAATAIENARLFEQTRRQLRDLTTISNASQTLSSAPLATGEVADIIAQIFLEVIVGTSTASIAVLDPTTPNHMRTLTSLRRIGEKIEREESLEQYDFYLTEYPATKRVMQRNKPLVVHINDPDADPRELEYLQNEEVSTLFIIPLSVKGEAIGIVELEYNDEIYHISPEEENLALTLANQAAVTLENARLYEEQRETAEQLREVDTLKSQFLANMSHELRTPLNSIIGFSRVILKGIDGPITDLQQQDLSAIYNAGQHLLNMINDILDISKIEAGKMDLAFDNIDIQEIINSVLPTARGLIKDKPVELIANIDDDLPIISADPTRVRQILLNLISNAGKFTDEGSITINASKRMRKDGGEEIYIALTDTGAGIAEEDQHKLFVPFSQVDGSPTRKVGGTGLGLSITRLLVDLHGGDIDLDSTEGEGSTFWFTLPLSKNEHQANNDGNLTIVAIDADSQVISLYNRYLSNAGYKVIAVTDPHDALDEIRFTKPFAVTLDIMMQDFDGWKLLENIKSDPEISHTPVVICTIVEEQEKGRELGATDYLTKPILEDDLVHAMNKLRGGKKDKGES